MEATSNLKLAQESGMNVSVDDWSVCLCLWEYFPPLPEPGEPERNIYIYHCIVVLEQDRFILA